MSFRAWLRFPIRKHLSFWPIAPAAIRPQLQMNHRTKGVPVLIQIKGWRSWCGVIAASGTFGGCLEKEAMIRLIAVAFVLALASSAQALQPAPIHQTDEMIIKIREACGAGMHMVNGVCVRTHARRAASRCARGVTC
jgi:hypothetical protein